MNAIVLSGIEVSNNIKKKLEIDIKKLSSKNIIPKLVAILIGDHPASKIYVKSKKKLFLSMNCHSEIIKLSSNVKESDVVSLINDLNSNNKIHGILLQLPIPKHLNAKKIIESINPNKDVDGLHPMNSGYLLQGNPNFIPCTPMGCIEILKYYNINITRKNVVIIGRSNLVGKPLFAILSQNFKHGNATVTLCHSYTKNLSLQTNKADIIIVAAGKPNLLNKSMVKKDAVIIDVGINRIKDNSKKGYSIVGDANYKDLIKVAKAITPVPGGVGPMTVTMLLSNTILSAKKIIFDK